MNIITAICIFFGVCAVGFLATVMIHAVTERWKSNLPKRQDGEQKASGDAKGSDRSDIA